MTQSWVLAISVIVVVVVLSTRACPEGCQCFKDVPTVHCNAPDLDHIPQGIPGNTTLLQMQGTKLAVVRKGDLRDLPLLRTLYLSGNRLQTIEVGVFDDTPALVDLEAGNNQISELSAGVFRGLDKLQEVHLSLNSITHITAGVFSSRPNQKSSCSHHPFTRYSALHPRLPKSSHQHQNHTCIHAGNKWEKRSDMLQKPLRPQAVTYQGRIYCMDTFRDARVEMYNPTTREWKQSWNGSYGCSTAILMKYGETMYLLTVQYGMGAYSNTTFIYKYQPETDSWLKIKDRGSLVAPLAEWLGDGSSTDCLTARMVPKCLGDPDLYDDDHDGGGDDDLSSSESPRSDRDSDDLSDQEDDY